MSAPRESIVAIVEARMTSSRLPGKVLQPAGGRPMLEHLVNRLRATPSIDKVVIATTGNDTDAPLVALAGQLGISSFRGSEPDVMRRVLEAAQSVDADIIVGVTGDCPLVDPLVTEQVIRLFLNNSCDYATNGHIPTYPEGLGVQVYRRATLARSLAMTADAVEHEHVTLHMRRHPELFRHVYLPAPPDQHWPELHLSLDEEADYRLLKAIIEHFGTANPLFSCREMLVFLKSRPDLVAINQAVKVRAVA